MVNQIKIPGGRFFYNLENIQENQLIIQFIEHHKTQGITKKGPSDNSDGPF